MFAFLITVSYPVTRKVAHHLNDSNSSLLLSIHSLILFGIYLTESFFPFLSSILWIFSIPSIVCAIKSRKVIMLMLVFLYIIFSLIFNPSKLAVLLISLTIFIAANKYFFTLFQSKIMQIVLVIVGFIFIILSFQYVNKSGVKYDSSEGLDYYSNQGVEFSNSAADFFMPYMYLTTPWTNLQYVMESQDTRTYGLWTIKPFLGYLQLDDFFKDYYSLEPYSSFNTFTFITCGYKDFGFLGSVLASFFLGLYVRFVYSRFIYSESPFDLTIYICVALATTNMSFSNHFLMVSYPFTIFVVMKVYRLFFRF